MSYASDREKGVSYTDGQGNYMEEPVPSDDSRPVPAALTKEQQEYLARASAEAMANLALVVPPVLTAFQQMAASALPALKSAIEPFFQALSELQIDSDTAVKEMLRLRAEEENE
jgi:hypothetical protein